VMQAFCFGALLYILRAWYDQHAHAIGNAPAAQDVRRGP
jgi:hypothetical protein